MSKLFSLSAQDVELVIIYPGCYPGLSCSTPPACYFFLASRQRRLLHKPTTTPKKFAATKSNVPGGKKKDLIRRNESPTPIKARPPSRTRRTPTNRLKIKQVQTLTR